MIRHDSKDINPYILSDEAHFQVTRSHYVIDEGHYRDLQRKRLESNKKIMDFAASLGVDFVIPQPDVEGTMKRIAAQQLYLENREYYDACVDKVLAVCPAPMILEYLKSL